MTSSPKTRALLAGASFLLATNFLVAPAFALVTASLSDSKVAVGQSFTLQLKTDKASGSASPDLSPLSSAFDILGTSQGSQTSIINGVRSDEYSWNITLAPKARGTTAIPPLTIGNEQSQALSIEVVDAADLPVADSASGISMELLTDPKTHYVQEEIPVTLRITVSGALQEAGLEPPAQDGFILKQRGEDRTSRINRNGRELTLIERDYLLKPQVSGKLEVPPMVLTAVVADPAAARRSPFGNDAFFSRFGGGLFDQMMNPGRRVVVRSQPLTLDIKGRPGQADGWFLPAKKVELESVWNPDNPVIKVGEPVTRTVRLYAVGASKEQLPDIEVPVVAGAKVYLENTNDKSVDTSSGTAALREFTMSVLATQEGEFTLPAIEVKWWNTQTDKQETATLPAETFMTENAAMASNVAPMAASSRQPDNVMTTRPDLATGTSEPWRIGIWPWAALGAAGLAAAGLAAAAGLIALRSSRNKARPKQSGAAAASFRGSHQKAIAASLTTAARNLRAACKSNDPDKAYLALLHWINLAGKTAAFDVDFETVRQDYFASHIAELEDKLFSNAATKQWNGKSLLADFNRAEAKRSRHPSTKRETLPTLYPEMRSPVGST
ncbi:BatD family protein [Hoeflea sp.]|uniref:BatD family protein n=1 Tax=Hoeflea sp. TaxID=1940281 RepID=UPI0037487E74